MSKNLSNKTCGDCKCFVLSTEGWCTGNDGSENANNDACSFFEPKVILNGDKIRQMSNEELAERLGIHAMCDFCPAETADCQHGHANIKYCKINWLNWLNAPAESDVCVAQNAKNDTQTDLCCNDDTQDQEGKDE